MSFIQFSIQIYHFMNEDEVEGMVEIILLIMIVHYL